MAELEYAAASSTAVGRRVSSSLTGSTIFICRLGGIGRHTALKMRCPLACRFESDRRYQIKEVLNEGYFDGDIRVVLRFGVIGLA